MGGPPLVRLRVGQGPLRSAGSIPQGVCQGEGSEEVGRNHQQGSGQKGEWLEEVSLTYSFLLIGCLNLAFFHAHWLSKF